MASVAQQKKKSKRKKQKKSNHTVLFHSGDMEDQRRTLLSFLCFPHILLSAHLKHTPFTSLIFCLLICFASKLSAVPAVSCISASSSLSPHINSLHWSITLTFFFFSPLLPAISRLYLISLLFHPLLLSLICLLLCLLPSVSIFFAAALPLSAPLSLHFFCCGSPSQFLPLSCSVPFLLIHPPTLSPSFPLCSSSSLPLSRATGRSLWLSHRPPVSVLLTAPFTYRSIF